MAGFDCQRAGSPDHQETSGKNPSATAGEGTESRHRSPVLASSFNPGHSSAPSRSIPSSPRTADPITLEITKTQVGNYPDPPYEPIWELDLSWSGGQIPYAVSYSLIASFQSGNITLAANDPDTTFSILQGRTKTLECFEVSDSTFVSQSVQGIGYDPYPPPGSPAIAQDGLWWGDTLTLNGNYYDPVAGENMIGLASLYATGQTASGGGGGFASEVTFTIPEDGRGAWGFIYDHGQTCLGDVPFVHLYPRGISQYGTIKNIVYAPQTGHVWVAADSTVDEIDLFLHDPVVVRSITGYSNPYISRVTDTGVILVVDGVDTVNEVDQIDVTTGIVSFYAPTKYGGVTRSILPVGIGATPNGTACYIADAIYGAGQSRLMKIPTGSTPTIIDNFGNWPNWNFPDPCGMEVGKTGRLYAGNADNWIGVLYASGSGFYATYGTDAPPESLEVDRDLSYSSRDWFYWNPKPGCMAFNNHEIQSLITSTPARHVGSDVFAKDGWLSVEGQGEYAVRGSAPKAVILNNQNQAYPYPTNYQVADRVVRLSVHGWSGVQVHLRLIDPPDNAAYAPFGGWPAQGGKTAVPPYEANDNQVWNDLSVTDFGLSAAYPGTLSGPILDLDVTPDSSNYATFYLKLPPRYSGDNWEIEVTKRNSFGSLILDKIPSYSCDFTGWKRVFVERDKMFRRGGLLFTGYGVTGQCGGSGQPPCCGTMGQLPCNQIEVYDWTNADIWDTIVVFDETSTAEGAGEIRVITGEVDNYNGRKVITLDSTMSNSYWASDDDGANPPKPIFANNHSGGYGVLSGCDPAANQLNASGSCFYDADMSDIQEPFDDGFVQFIGLRSGMGAMPYLSPSWFDSSNPQSRAWLSKIWFYNFMDGGPPPPSYPPGSPNLDIAHNYMHLMGVSGFTNARGYSRSDYDFSLTCVECIEVEARYYYASSLQTAHMNQAITCHEPGHQFNVNACSSGGHDSRDAWCDSNSHCALGGTTVEPCIMQNGLVSTFENLSDGVNRFCPEDLFLGDPNCSSPPYPQDGAIRTNHDPL
jgi:hypothetical protein